MQNISFTGMKQIGSGSLHPTTMNTYGFSKIIITLLIVIHISGCTVVSSNITVFHDLPPTTQPLKYAIFTPKNQEDSLEYSSYQELIREELNKLGYIETPLANADVIVIFEYGIDTGREKIFSEPIIGQTGVASSHTTGTITNNGQFSTYSETSENNPTYGVVGSRTRTATVYTRYLRLDFISRPKLADGKIKKRYEAKVISEGTSGQTAVIVPIMIKAIFQDFPGKSGTTRLVSIPMS